MCVRERERERERGGEKWTDGPAHPHMMATSSVCARCNSFLYIDVV